MNYQKFEPIDFILDESFQDWVLSPTPASEEFWQGWIRQNSHKEAVVQQARAVLLNIDFQDASPGTFNQAKVLENVKAIIKADELTNELNIPRPNEVKAQRTEVNEAVIYALPRRKIWYRISIAAAASVLILLGVWQLFTTSAPHHYATEFGETRELLLPDGSTVVLNANSSISYYDWTIQEDREVDVSGEAFFKVVHTENDQRFVVHSEGVGIEVLGTAFNVNNRRGRTQVVLQSGKVALSLTDQKLPSEETAFSMQPGDLVEVAGRDKKITKRVVNPEKYAAWTQGVLIFDNVPLREVFEIIQDTYGYDVTVKAAGIEHEMLEAEIASTDIDLIIEILSKSFSLNIEKHPNQLIVRKK